MESNTKTPKPISAEENYKSKRVEIEKELLILKEKIVQTG
jgi:hypothetical protein